MPWSINGREIFAELTGGFPMETDDILDWAEERGEIDEYVMADLRQHMPRCTWEDRESFVREVENYTWTRPDGALEPVWGGVTQAGLD
jgi:hypothetical protein